MNVPVIVSVIVPTHGRPASLQRLRDALERQTFRDHEVIVVDGAHGAVAARRDGVARANGRILAFTDDDCVPDDGWLAAGVAAIDAGADVAQGRTVPERVVRPGERSIEHAADDGLFPTCNVFYRRDAYDAAGGFDADAAQRLGIGGGLGFGEDTLLGWRVARTGRAAACPEAIVRHEVVRVGITEAIRRAWMARGFPALVREVPELRGRVIQRGVVLGRPDARLGAYGLPMLGSSLTWPLGLAAVAWWTLGRLRRTVRRRAPGTRGVAGVPRALLVDLVTCAALLWGSVRARTPVV